MDLGEADGMLIPSDSIAVRMTHWYVGRKQSYPLVSWSTSRCNAMTGQRDSEF